MFRKLISNLPFNPSLIGEVAFYYMRLKREEGLRRFGLVLIVLSFMVQSFAVIVPPQPTLAESANDIIEGGFDNRDQAYLHCLDTNKDFGQILAHYRVTCDILAGARTRMLRSTEYDKQLYSMGRKQKGDPIARTGKPSNEYPVTINGGTYWMRYLWAFDTRSYSDYRVLEMGNLDGKTIFILYDCGNIVTVDKYSPPVPKQEPEPQPKPQQEPEPEPEPEPQPEPEPKPEPQQEPEPVPEPKPQPVVIPTSPQLVYEKTASNLTRNIDDANGTQAKPGDTIAYTLTVKNTGNGDANNVDIEEDLTDVLEYASLVDDDGGRLSSDNVLRWPDADIAAGSSVSKTITVKVDDEIKATPTSTSDPSSYDLIMTNVFHDNTVNIKLPPPIGKTAEIITQELPKTGPGESMLAVTAITVVVSYFAARTHLLRKETQLVRTQFAAGGN